VRKLIACVAVAAFAAPALAQQPTTLQEITTKGIVIDAGGMQIDVKYTPDGKFTAMDGQVTGTWRIDGEKLCTTSNFSPAEECTVYPAGKKSGDSFDLTGAQGPATIKIK
jgi:hypothetical protein